MAKPLQLYYLKSKADMGGHYNCLIPDTETVKID
jgi:hypothetical protein